MSHYSTHYRTGEEIHIGDQIALANRIGHVVFVLGVDEFPPDWAGSKDWFEKQYTEGFMLNVNGMGFVFQNESDEDLKFCGRRP